MDSYNMDAGAVLVALAVIIVAVMVKDRIDMYKTDPISSLPLPPGGYGLPIIGESIAIFRSGMDPERWHKKYGKICKTSMVGRSPLCFLMDPDVIEEFFRKHKGPLLRPGSPFSDTFFHNTILTLVGKEHKKRRTVLLPAFTARNMRGYVTRTQELVQGFLDKWSCAGSFEARRDIVEMTFAVSAAFFLGAHDQHYTAEIQRHFAEFDKATTAVVTYDLPFTQFRKAKKSRKWLLEFVEGIINKRRETMEQNDCGVQNDPLSFLMRQTDEDGVPLPSKEIASSGTMLLFAGFHTTKSSLYAILHKLIKHPDVQRKLRSEIRATLGSEKSFTLEQINGMEYLDKFLAEVFRTLPVFNGNAFRQTTQTVEVGGYQIPKGWFIAAQRVVLDRNESMFEKASEFNPDRPLLDYTHPNTGQRIRNMSIFGFGPYECLGKHFAQLERKIFTILLVRQFTPRLIRDSLPEVTYRRIFMNFNDEFHIKLEPLNDARAPCQRLRMKRCQAKSPPTSRE